MRPWPDELEECLDAIRRCEGDRDALRNILFGLYQLIQSGPLAVQNAFKDISEDKLRTSGRSLGEELTSGVYTPPKPPSDLTKATLLASKLLRGVEQALFSLGERDQAPRRAVDLEVTFGGKSGWLLPFSPRFRGEPTDWPPYFAKRALVGCRCLPRELPTGYKINLQLLGTDIPHDLIGAACLFEHFTLLDENSQPIDETSTGPFVVTRLEGRGSEALKSSLEFACEPTANATAVVFPELSVTPEEQALIQQLLRQTPWDKSLLGHRPSLIVAGSWHDRRDDGRFENRAPVFDANGQLIGRHVKHAVFGANAPSGVLKENIERGGEILVVASRTLTVALAICLDFCQASEANPYDELDVDLVLVTSLANDTTGDEHAKQASRIWTRRKSATFLAQQSETAAGGICGANPSDKPFVEKSGPSVVTRRISPSA